MAKKRFYAVVFKDTNETKIYTDWKKCEASLKGRPNEFRGFATKDECEEFFVKKLQKTKENKHNIPLKEGMAEVVVKFVKPLYKVEEHVLIGIYQEVDTGKNVTIVGTLLPSIKNVKFRVTGEWVKHPKYGMQLKAESYKEEVGTDKNNIIAYLASGIIKGIGKVTAERIYDAFGENTLTVLDNDIDRLLEIKGITKKKLEKIRESYFKTVRYRDVIMELSKHGISPKLATKVAIEFKGDTMEVIKNAPYKLSYVKGISFAVADAFGPKTEWYERNEERFNYCARYVIFNNENNAFSSIIGNRASGSLGMQKDDFGKVMLTLLRKINLSGEWICEQTMRMINEGTLVCRKIENDYYLFLKGIFDIEKSTAEHIYRICSEEVKKVKNIDKWIKEAEAYYSVTLSDKQRNAVKEAFENNLSIIIGPPGTGKTMIIKIISYIYGKVFKKNDKRFIAPSGKAASRIKETTGENASTVHSFLKIGIDVINQTEGYEESKADNELIVIDEMSMLDTRTAYRLFAAIGDGCKIIICGDDEQLPSVGAGAVLRDLIECRALKVTVLDCIYRQGAGSVISSNAMLMRKGDTNITCGAGFNVQEVESLEQAEKNIVDTYVAKVAEYGIDNVMLIVPFKKYAAGVQELNVKIQEKINPEKEGKLEFVCKDTKFRVGDIVMQLKNEEGGTVVNGDIGIVKAIYMDDGDETLMADFNGTEKEYTKADIEELTLAYAYTIHKSQGSEADCVITCAHRFHSVMLKRNVFYTAVTRAKKEVLVFGERIALDKAIQTEDASRRITTLQSHLKVMFGEWLSIHDL